MQETRKSIFLVFAHVIIFLTLRLPIYYVNIKSTLEILFSCGHFSTTMYILICMVDARHSFDLSSDSQYQKSE